MKRKIGSAILTLLILLHTFGAISFRVNAANEPSDWAVTEINRAIEEGLVTDRVTKNYQKEITREEFCELAVQLYRKTAGKTIAAADNPFTDTNNGEILKAYSLGIVSGVSETEFAPNDSITRQEMCVMLVRAIGAILEDEFVLSYEFYDFADDAAIADWAFEQVYYAYEKGIIKGIGDHKIDPLGTATCEQAIIMAVRIYETIDNCRGGVSEETLAAFHNYTEVKEAVKQIASAYEDAEGYIPIEKSSEAAQKICAGVEKLIRDGKAKSYYKSEKANSVLVVLNDGSLYLYVPSLKDRYSGESDFNVFTVDTVGNAGTSATDKILLGLHKGGAMSSGDYMVENNENCHTKFSVYKNNSDISRIQYYLRRVNGLEINAIFWRGHGSLTLDSQIDPEHEIAVLCSYEKVSEESDEKYIKELGAHTVIRGDHNYWVTPKFFDAWMNRADGGVFYCGACFSMADTGEKTLAKTIVDKKGFDCFFGSGDSIIDSYSDEFMYQFAKSASAYDAAIPSSTNQYETAYRQARNTMGDSDENGCRVLSYGDLSKRLVDCPVVQSANIAEYKGVMYTTNGEVPGMVQIPVQPARYDYICSIAFYGDRLYYSCKETGSSDYRSAIYSCNPDGSDQKLIYDPDGGTATGFMISGNKLYLSEQIFTPAYIDLTTNTYVPLDRLIDTKHNDFLLLNDNIYSTYQTSSKKVKEGSYIRYRCKYDVYKTNVNTGERQCIKKDISSVPDLKVSSDGNFYYLDEAHCLYGIKNGNPVKLYQFDRYISIVSIIGSTVYYDYVEDNTTYLAYYDINTHASGVAASHRAASSGHFFNW